MFRIELVPAEANLGQITMGSFSERFEIDTTHWSANAYVANWRVGLRALVERQRDRIALMTWPAREDSDSSGRAWILYREGDEVFVQERLFVPDDDDFTTDGHGAVTNFGEREVTSDDGSPISEWRTGVDDIEACLNQLR
jgi:hypothetical protein